MSNILPFKSNDEFYDVLRLPFVRQTVDDLDLWVTSPTGRYQDYELGKQYAGEAVALAADNKNWFSLINEIFQDMPAERGLLESGFIDGLTELAILGYQAINDDL